MSGHFSAENIGHGTATHQPRPATDQQPGSFAFDTESENGIAKILARYPEGRQASAVIPLLYIAQNQMGRQTGSGWVPRAAMDTIAVRLGMPPIRVYEVATFYLMFNTKPVGRYHLQVCTTTPCWLRGSEDVVTAAMAAAGLQHFEEVSADYYEDLDGPRTTALIEALKRGERPRRGPTIDRYNSAPAGGRTTLLEDGGEHPADGQPGNLPEVREGAAAPEAAPGTAG